jgi:hypothetical protein
MRLGFGRFWTTTRERSLPKIGPFSSRCFLTRRFRFHPPVRPSGLVDRTRGQNYEGFRKQVFEGPLFTQTFRDVHIQQDGPLANVSLVFVNSSADGSSWGWKTMQLLKIDGRWKIASEFFTGHRLE